MSLKLKLINLVGDIKNRPLEYLTMFLAMLGATFVADAASSMRCLGFCIWIISNGYLAIGFYRLKNVPYFIMFMYYEYQNIRGIVNNWNF